MAKRKPAPAPTPPTALVVVPKFFPQPPAPSGEAVALFQAGMEALQRHGYSAAAARFRELLDAFPGERALLDRTRVYLDLCERELARQPAALRTVEDRLTAATMALNQDDDAQAESLARGVLNEAPQQDLALYLLAAVSARRGDQDAALEFLGRAFASRPDARAQARHDADFDGLRDTEQFHALLELPPTVVGRPLKAMKRRA